MVDREIREALCVVLESRYAKVRIMDEFVIGKARADIVTVTDSLTGYEIKGDSDSYTRLPTQVKEYDRYFQQNYLVVGKSHSKSAAEHIPPYWGIVCVSESGKGVQVKTLRKAAHNPKFSIKKQLSVLWRMELVHILQANKLPKCAGKRKAYIRGYLMERIPQDTLRLQICEELFERDWTVFA